jgi:uncharacterized phosphosugar-binding protein
MPFPIFSEGMPSLAESYFACTNKLLAQAWLTNCLTVVALSCLARSRVTPSQHPSGKRLIEYADHVLGNGGVPGDAAVEWLKIKGHPLPLLRSQNLPGAIEHNRELGQKYKGRLSRQLA